MKKYIIYLFGGGLLLTLFFILKGNKNGDTQAQNQKMSGGGFPSLQPDQINRIAQMQFDSMTQLGTDSKILFDSLKGCNTDDLKAVFNAFSTKKYLGASGTGLLANWFGYDLDLFGWYVRELGESDLIKMRQFWSSKNIKTSF
jgi:hypothetical protein